MPLLFEVKFVGDTTFQASYIRNNPRKGIKHLRCFPACLPQGHRRSRFCGRPLDAEVRVIAAENDEIDASQVWTDDLEFIGEFVSATEEQPERGLIVPQSWFESQTHGPHNPVGDVYRGTVISTFHGPIHTLPSLPPALLSNANPILAQQTMVVKTFLVRFNDNPDAAWQCGVRSSSRTRHCFRIAVLRRVPEIVAVDEPAMSLEEIAALTSTPFRIISARRLSSQHLLQNDRLKSRTFESKSECSSKREASSDDAETDELPDDA